MGSAGHEFAFKAGGFKCGGGLGFRVLGFRAYSGLHGEAEGEALAVDVYRGGSIGGFSKN